jgi:hypothetical protein
MARSPVRLLSRREASRYIEERHGQPCALKTLAKKASVGGGPPFRKAGRHPLYDPADLDAWAQARLSPRIETFSELKRGKRES